MRLGIEVAAEGSARGGRAGAAHQGAHGGVVAPLAGQRRRRGASQRGNRFQLLLGLELRLELRQRLAQRAKAAGHHGAQHGAVARGWTISPADLRREASGDLSRWSGERPQGATDYGISIDIYRLATPTTYV
jgi:hypothetical protein